MVRGVAALVALAALPSATAFRADPPPPSDIRPLWSPDASAIVYMHDDGRRHRSMRVMSRVGTGDRRLAIPAGSVFSPDWRWVASVEFGPSRGLFVSTPEGEARHRVADGFSPAWAPTSDRLAFVALEDPLTLEAVNADGSGRAVVTDSAIAPSWSPDGRRIAFRYEDPKSPGRAPFAVGVVDPDGRNPRLLYRTNDLRSFEWSPDGRTIAVLSRNRQFAELRPYRTSSLSLLSVDRGLVRTFSIPLAVSDLAWSPDGKHIALDGLLRFDIAQGRAVRLLRFGADPRYSPDGRQIVFSGGGACGERAGVFVVAARGGRPARLTNDCRVVGGPGNDVLHGSEFSDVLLGLDGDDVLTALDDFSNEGDVLDGGPGNDRLTGSIGTDVLRGGPGRDVLDGAGAPDVVYAVDGERDTVDCGTTAGSDIERDRAYVDKEDVVQGCEYVFRRHGVQRLVRTSLSITVWPRGRVGEFRRRVLACSPPRGTLPHRKEACGKLARFGDPFAPIPLETDCPVRTVEPAVALISGRFRGRHVTVWMRRSDGCAIARWDRFSFLFVS